LALTGETSYRKKRKITNKVVDSYSFQGENELKEQSKYRHANITEKKDDNRKRDDSGNGNNFMYGVFSYHGTPR
jgi:hypothetical protein